MLVGPNHPMFGVPQPGPMGSDGLRLPPGAVPPGARFDPIMGGPLAGTPPFPGQRIPFGPGVGRGRGSGMPFR
jgi:proteasome inhibitor subunit 1 (PI31)